MPITALYAGLLALLFLSLSILVIRQRRSSRVPLGDGGDAALLRRIRVQGNFAEYTPLALILLGAAESLRTAPVVLHCLGLLLLFARCVHAIGVSRPNEDFRLRVAGVGTTLTVIGLLAVICIAASLR